MSNRTELLSVMRTAREELDGVVERLAGELGGDAGIGNDWHVRDSLMHVALWERVAARKIAGTPLPDGEELLTREPWDLDSFNDAMRERWRSMTDDAIVEEFGAAHRALLAAVEAADETACAHGGVAWRAIEEDGAGHYSDHFAVVNRMAEGA